MTKHNAALGNYIGAWQNMIGSLALSHENSFWHDQAQPSQGDVPLMTLEAWYDLERALEQYELWQATPSYNDRRDVVWRHGSAQLLDFGGEGAAILMVPSMINGHEILHMPGEVNLAEYLWRAGFHPYLLDWGKNAHSEAMTRLEDYEACLRAASDFVGESTLLGYCLGGTLAHQTTLPNVKAQVLIGAPWRFQHNQGRMGAFSEALKAQPDDFIETSLAAVGEQFGCLPSLFIDMFFALLNPLQFVEKFRGREAHENLVLFDALEDWLNTGRDLPIALSRTILSDWFRDDTLCQSEEQNNTPTLAIYGKYDHIAPPISCKAVASSGNQVQLLEHRSGHVGLLVGRASIQNIWPKLVNYLQDEFV